MSFVASCHHLVAQCFRLHGNAKHGLDDKVSLEEVQAAIREEFLDASGRLPLQGRGSFLESVQESSLAWPRWRAGGAPGGHGYSVLSLYYPVLSLNCSVLWAA